MCIRDSDKTGEYKQCYELVDSDLVDSTILERMFEKMARFIRESDEFDSEKRNVITIKIEGTSENAVSYTHLPKPVAQTERQTAQVSAQTGGTQSSVKKSQSQQSRQIEEKLSPVVPIVAVVVIILLAVIIVKLLTK